jgi:hypothetical protein
MHPDVVRQLAAERQADLHREADARTNPARAPRRRWRRLRLRLRLHYADAATGSRAGT